jgi:AraC-like DNA-binding protein
MAAMEATGFGADAPAPQFLHIGAYSAPRGQDYPTHRHVVWELVLYREGHIEAPIGDEVFLTRPGLLLLTPPGVPHAERALTAYSNYFMTVAALEDYPWPRSAQDDAVGSFGYVFRSLAREHSRPESKRRSTMIALLMAQLDCILRDQTPGGLSAGERAVREAERLFEERFGEPVSIAAVAVEVGISGSALRAHFARQRGCSPAHALQKVRLRQAMALLSGSDLALDRVASACGFHSASHLSRQVKSATGLAPGKWRRGIESRILPPRT